ncbi:uncharacterized protein [Amphiura filiformis]|uniref:uncharacterized protein isoform X2 n=1 Tax=Amphiura filiformis TaxID=82378 RepID=UPI003B21F0F0
MTMARAIIVILILLGCYLVLSQGKLVNEKDVKQNGAKNVNANTSPIRKQGSPISVRLECGYPVGRSPGSVFPRVTVIDGESLRQALKDIPTKDMA